MRFSTLVAAAVSFIAGAEAGLQAFGVPAHIKPGDSFTVHTKEATTRAGEYHIYWGHRILGQNDGASKTEMGTLFHVTNYRDRPYYQGGYNGTIQGLRLPDGLDYGHYALHATVTQFVGVFQSPSIKTWYLEFDVADYTDDSSSNVGNLVWTVREDPNGDGCSVPYRPE